jgi:hypothetical protein
MQGHVEGVSGFKWKALIEDDMRWIKDSQLAFSQSWEAVSPEAVPERDAVLGDGMGEVGHESEPESAGVAAYRHAPKPAQIRPDDDE